MLISVIVPTCLRSVNELIRAIDSVIWNGYHEIEVVVVNDNRVSKFEDFSEINERYCHAPVQFLYNTEKQGAASARNYGVKHASGELVTFLDDDDFILPGRLERMHTAFIEFEPRGVSLISTGRVYQYENYAQLQIVKRQLFGIVTLKDIYIHNDIDIGFMVRKSLFLELNGFDQSYHNLEDWDFIIRALKCANAYKLRSFSYIIKNDATEGRVSNNDYIGLQQIQVNHGKEFGADWSAKIAIQALRSKKELGIIEVLKATLICRDAYPVRQYIGSLKSCLSR
ncbi:glycosyltransferase family 2 protein [Vibrio sp. 1863]|uniref:glycosyltransferase family 2 protein n=1 Tax=Vibrio sp. 1863 TaxID=3074579 RepID=UPI002964E4C8|nr:glycosyltransferase family 2 protein [Vibrio sp. 1863]MDW2075392.1 glycosyltransferase family 2 protein [Vibrio sp. 1863]